MIMRKASIELKEKEVLQAHTITEIKEEKTTI